VRDEDGKCACQRFTAVKESASEAKFRDAIGDVLRPIAEVDQLTMAAQLAVAYDDGQISEHDVATRLTEIFGLVP
jgi:hypothetical protein